MIELTSKERVLKALENKEPDRVPIDLGGYQTGIMVNAYNDIKKLLDTKKKTSILHRNQQLAVPDEEILKHFHIDTRYIFPRSFESWNPQKLPDGSLIAITEWCNQRVIKKPTSPYFDYYDSPLDRANIENINDFSWPDPEIPQRFDGLKEEIENIYRSTNCAIVL